MDTLSMKIPSDLFCMRFVRYQLLVSFTVTMKVHYLLCRPLVSVWTQSYSLLLTTCCLPAPYCLLWTQKAVGGIFLLLYLYTCPENKCLYFIKRHIKHDTEHLTWKYFKCFHDFFSGETISFWFRFRLFFVYIVCN